MKRLGITQRVENILGYSERRDCLDQRWTNLALQLGYLPCPLPNVIENQVSLMLDNLKLDGVLLSGGNSISHLNPEASDAAPERDVFESVLLRESLERELPVVGVCRGMQLINVNLGGRLSPLSGHVAKRHLITYKDNSHIDRVVNSYHSWGIPSNGLAANLTSLAFDLEGNVEAFECAEKQLLGMMWHPEREQPFHSEDLQLIKKYLL